MTLPAAAPAAQSVVPARLQRRLLPLWAAAFLQAVGFWVPVEKLFMAQIGFDAASVGLMAAAYAALVPFAEVVSGVLADRWSRRGVLVVAGVALLTSVTVAALSHSVVTYIVAALILGIYFAMYSGTVEAIVYDVVLEETGDSTAYERQIGRVRLIESIALVSSALIGGWIASMLTPRAAYVLTLPFAVLYLLVLTQLREPTLHRTEVRTTLRSHLSVTYHAIADGCRLIPIAAATLMGAMILQAMFEFGPLWLVALQASAVYYGPFWALLVGTLGVGGLLAHRLRLNRLVSVVLIVATMLAACLAMTTSHNLAVLTAAMVTLTFLLVVIGIHLSQLLHDAVPSTIRTGVASGISALSWVVFTPFALVFGAVAKRVGVYTSGWMITGAVAVAGVALIWVQRRQTALR